MNFCPMARHYDKSFIVHEDYFMLALTHVSNQPHSELDSHKTEARKYSSVNNT